MSVSVTLRDFKNKADKKRKINDYLELLKLQQQININAQEANQEYYRNLKMGIKPTPQKVYKSSDEELADTIYQREIALTNLREIFKYGNDASTALNYLSTDLTDGSDLSELALFNRHWDDFASQLSKTRNVTPTFFNQAWNRYKLKLANTNNTGIQIPIDSTQFTEHMKQLGNEIETKIKENYSLTSTQFRDTRYFIEEAIKERDHFILEKFLDAIDKRNSKVIQEILESRRMKFDEMSEAHLLTLQIPKLKKILTTLADIPNSTFSIEAYFDRPLQDLKESDYVREIIALNKKKYDEGKETTFVTPQKRTPYRALPTRDYTEDTLSRYDPAELKQILADISGIANTPSSIEGLIRKKFDRITKQDLINEILAQNVEFGDEPTQRALFQSPTPTPASTPAKTSGKKGRPPSSGKSKGKGIIKGKGLRGITPSFEEKFTTFGRYLIHVPSLKNCKLNLKYPSKGYIQPAKEISHQLKDLILYVLENGSVDFTMYESLTPDDKKFFNEICHKASITEGLGLKYSNDDKKEKVKRFNILKGQIEAGNDNKEIREELKLLILEFIDNGTVNAKSGLDVLRELDMI